MAGKKGKPRPAEVRAKIAASQRKRYEEDPNARKKISEANRRRYEDPAEREKTAEGQRRRYEDPVEHEKTSNGVNAHYRENPGARQKMSEAQKKRYEDPAEREKTAEGQRRRYSDPKELEAQRARAGSATARKKRSESHKKRYEDNPRERRLQGERIKRLHREDPEISKKMSAAQKKRYEENPEERKRMSKQVRERYQDPAERKRQSKAQKKRFQENPDQLIKFVRAGRTVGRRGIMTSIEKMIADALEERGIAYVYEKPTLEFLPDFMILDNIIIEVDGEHWHSTPEQIAKDEERDAKLQDAGYEIWRLKEDWVRKNPGACVDLTLINIRNNRRVSLCG
jgi:very-short-patch-repair endonuclease